VPMVLFLVHELVLRANGRFSVDDPGTSHAFRNRELLTDHS